MSDIDRREREGGRERERERERERKLGAQAISAKLTFSRPLQSNDFIF